MSGILKSYFIKKTINNLNNSAYKFPNTYISEKRLFNSGLILSENNILKINKNIYNSISKIKNIDNNIEANLFNKNNLYNKNIFNKNFDNSIYSNFSLKKSNKKLKSINNLTPELTFNKIKTNLKFKKLKINLFPNLNQKKQYNKNIFLKYNKKNTINENVSIEKRKKDNSLEVENIINSLIDNRNDKEENFNKQYKTNIIFDKKKSIDPKTYINYNLQEQPNNKELFRSFDIQLNCINNKIEYRNKIIRGIDTTNRNRLKIENLKFSLNNNTSFDNNKKVVDDYLKNKMVNKKNFHFNIYDYYNNIYKKKSYNRCKFNKKMMINQNEINMDKNLLTFEQKVKNLETFTSNSIGYLKYLSKTNENMLKKLNNIYDIYDLYNK